MSNLIERAAALGLAVAMASVGAASARADDARRIQLAIDHTIASQLPNGLFRYDYDFLAGEPTGKDNIVRQAGALFALGEALVDTGDSRIEPVLRAGLERMAEESLPISRGSLQAALETAGVLSIPSWRWSKLLDRLGLLYRPQGAGRVVAEDGDYRRAYTGATALALIAELEYARATGDDRHAELREGWTDGLLSLHVPSRGIRASPVILEESSYVNGEAWLALAYYHESFPEERRVAQALAALDEYLLVRHAEEPDRFFFHWGAMASAERFATTADPRFAVFAGEQARWFMDSFPPESTEGQPTCSLIEGLASALAALEAWGGDRALVERIRQRIATELARNRPMQIQPNQERWEFGGGAVLVAPSLADHAGAFVAGPNKLYTRIDLTQHCISALLKVVRYGVLPGGLQGVPSGE